MKVGFIGLGNVGAKLAGSILRNGFDLTVRDLDRLRRKSFLGWAPRSLPHQKHWLNTVM